MKRPNWFLTILLGGLLRIFALFKGQRIRRIAKIHGPAIVLSNHTSFHDFIYTFSALYPHRVSFMAAGKMFYDPLLGFFLRLARAFPKCLFQADPVSTMNVFRILRQKGIVAIFPEGQISPIGVTQPISPAMAKLVKKAKVDVYMAKHKGAYLANPPWSKKTFRGPVETEVDLVLSQSRLAELSEAEILTILCDRLAYNVSAWNEEFRHAYRLNDIANLESVLYRCPACGNETLRNDGKSLLCPACGTTLTYDRFGKVGGRRIDDLYHAQERVVREEIEANPDFRLVSPVKLESYRGKRMETVGEGTLTLDRNEYVYEGTFDGEVVVKRFDPKNVPTLPSDLGRNVQIYEGYLIYQFVMEDVHLPTRFVIAGEILHGRRLAEEIAAPAGE